MVGIYADIARRFCPGVLEVLHGRDVTAHRAAETPLMPIRSVWAGTPARARRRRATAAAVTGRPTGCLASLPSMTSLSWLPAIKWTCTRSRTESRRLTMVDLRSCPFCGGNEIIIRPVYYAGIVNPRFYAQCRRCFAQTAPKWTTKLGAVKDWNRRADNG